MLRRRKIGEIGLLTFTRVDDHHPGRPGGGQHSLQRWYDYRQLGRVVAEGLTEPTSQQEIPLHIR